MILNADTSLLNTLSPLITAFVVIGVIICVCRAMWFRHLKESIGTIVMGGVLLWFIASPTALIGLIGSMISFLSGMFNSLQ